MADCVYREIVGGRSPVSTFYADELVLVFMTDGPVTEGHAIHLHVFPRYVGDPFRLVRTRTSSHRARRSIGSGDQTRHDCEQLWANRRIIAER